LYNTVAKPITRIAKVLGLDKPTSLARTQIGKINPYSDIANSRGIDTSVKLGVDPENAISTQPVVGGVSTDEMDIAYIAGTPTYYGTTTIDNTVPNNYTWSIFNTDMSTIGFSYANWLIQNVQYYSGSYKIKLYITASNMHAARVCFFLNTTPTAWQSCYHRIVDIQGDTEVEITLPYWDSTIQTKTMNTPMQLYMRLLAYSQPQETVTTPIYVNTYIAMASDFRISGPVNNLLSLDPLPTLVMDEHGEESFIVESNPRLDFQQDFQPLHESMTGYEQTNLVVGEKILNYRDFVHRYVPLRQIDNTSNAAYEGRGNLGIGMYTGLELYGLIYRFNRGSIRCTCAER